MTSFGKTDLEKSKTELYTEIMKAYSKNWLDLGCNDTGGKTLTELKGPNDMINALSMKQDSKHNFKFQT